MSEEFIHKMRHTAAHVLAMAVLQLFPDTKLGIGPVIENGFYYDFLFSNPITNEDLAKIEQVMKDIISAGYPVRRVLKSKQEAVNYYKELKQPFKLELLDQIEDDPVSFYLIDDGKKGFLDLCKGPHVDNTNQIGAIKLLNIAGAYWRGDEKNQMLTRIYGTAFLTQEELDEYLKNRELAQAHDHRVLNKKLGYYFIDSDLIGAGLIVWLPRGAYVKTQLENFILQKVKKYGYHQVVTPHVAKEDLWKISGHLAHYKKDMFPEMKAQDGNVYYMKPMNCPLHVQIFKRQVFSYKQLPFRVADIATVYRYEKPGELHGLTRVRGLTQDDGHIFCSEDQIEQELKSAINLAKEIYNTFGIENIQVDISVRDKENKKNYLGEDSVWQVAESALEKVVKESGFEYRVQEGEAAFYGPKIDFHMKDNLGRSWQLATIQLDFNLPHRFGIKYTGPDGKEHTPVMIHRAFYGTTHRFIGLLIEYFAGNLPLWLEYEKVWVLPISDSAVDYAQKVVEALNIHNLNAKMVYKNEPLQGRIKEAEELKIPYVLVVGEKEINTKGVSVRVRGKGNIGLITLNEFVDKLIYENENKLTKSVFI